MSDQYKSLRTVILELQAAPAKAGHKEREVWKTASGHYGAKNPSGTVDYFDDEQRAKAYSKGQGRGGSVDHGTVDSSREVPLDQDGYAKDGAVDQKQKPQTQAVEAPAPAAASQAKPRAAPQQGKSANQPTKTAKDQPQPEEEELVLELPLRVRCLKVVGELGGADFVPVGVAGETAQLAAAGRSGGTDASSHLHRVK